MKNSGQAGVLVLAILALLVGLYMLQLGMEARKVSEGIAETDIFEAMTPETLATTVLLAGFRGILADMLWLRAMDMEDRSEWFELKALYELITRLQPDFEEVWHFAAWNLAYNISYDAGSFDEKWKWIRDGTQLLLEGIDRNPRSFYLRWIMGQLYTQKYVESPIYLQRFREETGEHPYQEALKWFLAAADPERYPTHDIRIDVSLAHAYTKLGNVALEEQNYADAARDYENAIAQWRHVTKVFPTYGPADKNVLQIYRKLSDVYLVLMRSVGDRDEAAHLIGKMRALAEDSEQLWRSVPGDVERLLITATALIDLTEAEAAFGGAELAGDDIRKAQTFFDSVREKSIEAHKVEDWRPEYKYYQGKAAFGLARLASLLNQTDRVQSLLEEALQIDHSVKEELVSFGDSIRRTDYRDLERVVDKEIAELERLVRAHLGPSSSNMEAGGEGG